VLLENALDYYAHGDRRLYSLRPRKHGIVGAVLGQRQSCLVGNRDAVEQALFQFQMTLLIPGRACSYMAETASTPTFQRNQAAPHCS
jgi:hypothetical protein